MGRRNIMKKIVALGLMFILTISIVYAEFSTQVKEFYEKNRGRLEFKFYKERIPDEFSDAFLFYTDNDSELRLKFYSLMVVESANFKYYYNKNPNGTVDIGPSQLNSANLEDPWFVQIFSPKNDKYINTHHTYCMVLTINFFKDITTWADKEYKFMVYNGGPKAQRIVPLAYKTAAQKSFTRNVTNYDKLVRAQIEKTKEDFEKFVTNEYYNMSALRISAILQLKPAEELKSVIKNFSSGKKPIDFNKPRDNNVLYIKRRYNFVKFDLEEFIIENQSIIDLLSIKRRRLNITI
jgi:hypothetical protein